MEALRLVALLGCALAVSGAACQTTPRGSFCEIAKPLRFSQKAQDAMSADEVRDLLTFLQTGQALCNWQPTESE